MLKKSASDQKARIEKNAEKKDGDEETVTISANSIEELLQKIQDYSFAQRSDNIQTEEEKLIGQHINFKG